MHAKKPLVFIILDGWGYKEAGKWNAISRAHTPHWDKWWQTRPHMLLEASGLSVGLPPGQMGNSEVGHMHIGAGRLIHQDLTRINEAIRSGEFFANPVFLKAIASLKKTNKNLHIFGLLSHGGVHSHEEHLFAFLKLCAEKDFHNVCLHLFLDGRDSPPQSALTSLDALNKMLTSYPVAKICSLSGRYFAMDRDKHWERVEPVYQLLTEGKSLQRFPNAKTAVKAFYEQGISDEFIPPTLLEEGQGISLQDGDVVFFFNYRADRARQLTEAFLNPDFQGFERHIRPALSQFISMTQYSDILPTRPAFPPLILNNTLGEVIAKDGLTQLRIAETEKYAHVTYFFNGGSENVFPNEKRILIPSPRIATYDLKPEMSAKALTDALKEAIQSNHYDFIVCNYANADMVGHTGKLDAAIAAIACLDTCLYEIWNTVKEKQGQMIITSDHGNAEIMYDPETQQAHTAHTCEPVPFVYLSDEHKHEHELWQCKAIEGSLIDIAPTILSLLNIDIPIEMKGHSLVSMNGKP